jgi:hypothetical protein
MAMWSRTAITGLALMAVSVFIWSQHGIRDEDKKSLSKEMRRQKRNEKRRNQIDQRRKEKKQLARQERQLEWEERQRRGEAMTAEEKQSWHELKMGLKRLIEKQLEVLSWWVSLCICDSRMLMVG